MTQSIAVILVNFPFIYYIYLFVFAIFNQEKSVLAKTGNDIE